MRFAASIGCTGKTIDNYLIFTFHVGVFVDADTLEDAVKEAKLLANYLVETDYKKELRNPTDCITSTVHLSQQVVANGKLIVPVENRTYHEQYNSCLTPS